MAFLSAVFAGCAETSVSTTDLSEGMLQRTQINLRELLVIEHAGSCQTSEIQSAVFKLAEDRPMGPPRPPRRGNPQFLRLKRDVPDA